MNTRPNTSAQVAALLALSAGLMLANGCSSSVASKRESTLTTQDFKAAPSTVSADVPASDATTPPAPAAKPAPSATPMATTTPAAASDGLRDVAVLAGSPSGDVAMPSANPTNKPVVIDMLVGQINGKAVYADEFLGPLDGQLNAMLAESRNGKEWQLKCADLIYERLLSRIRDELILAEARSALSTEEKKGLISFLSRLRENLASLAQGSAVAADEKLRASDNTSLDDKAKTERDKILIRTLVQKNIEPRVNISWRDIQREYDRNYRLYNPAPVALLRLVECKASDAAAKSAIEADLAAGVEFAKIAASKSNSFLRSEAGMFDPIKIETTVSETTLINDKTLNAAAQKLSPGQIAGPIEYKSGTTPLVAWIKLEAIEAKPGRTLEEAQLEIASKLSNEKFNLEVGRFVSRLLDQGSTSNIESMTVSMVLIATERYLVNGDIPPGIKRTTPARPTRPTGPQRP